MPGVPSGRGCDTCRAQKKKCDLEQPVCTRCRKLRIKCVGAGERRYKFLDGNKWSAPSRKRPPAQHSKELQFKLDPLSQTPSDDTALLAQALVTRLRPWEDLRHHMAWAYGPFVTYLPSRLGHNEALDAATRTLLGLHMEACTYSYDRTHRSLLSQYNHAIKTLRKVLNDPVKAWETETLGAIVVLGACQARFDGPLANFNSAHGVGATHLLKARKSPTGQDPFETMLLRKIRSTMAVQAIFNHDIHLTPDDWRQLEHSFDGPDYEARLYRCASQLGELVTRGQAAVAYSDGAEHAAALIIAANMQQDLDEVQAELKQRLDEFAPQDHAPYCAHRIRGLLLRAYGAAVAFAAMLFCARRALAADSTDSTHTDTDTPSDNMHERLAALCSTAFWIRGEAEVFRPLGSTWVTCMFMAVWCAAKGSRPLADIEEAMDTFRGESLKEKDAAVPREQLETMWRRLSLVD